MDLSLSVEQAMLKESVESFARDYLRSERQVSRATAEGFSRDKWREITELGWLAVGLPEEQGGLGGSPVEAMLIHEGIGSGLIVEPLLSTSLAAKLIGLAGSRLQREALLPTILDGQKLAVLAHTENAGRGDPLYIECTAAPSGEGWVLCGQKNVVLDAPSADHVIVSARVVGSNELALFIVNAPQLSGRLMVCETIDGLRAADIFLDGLELSVANRMTGAPDPAAALIEAIDHAIIANCAEALGAMDAALLLTTEYINTRQQFGAPIGTFQALQHKLADMVIAVELARSILLQGVAALLESSPIARSRGVSAAKVRIIESAELVGAHAIQLHGGIGVTEECVVSHYFRKLVMLAQRFGNADYHVARFSAV